MTNKEKAFQQKQLEELRSGEEGCYTDASIYTILLDLCEGNGVEEIFMILHNVASDMGQRAELEDKFYDAKGWCWQGSPGERQKPDLTIDGMKTHSHPVQEFGQQVRYTIDNCDNIRVVQNKTDQIIENLKDSYKWRKK